MNENREDIINQIKELIVTSKDDVVDINPVMLEYFNDEDLISLRDDLLIKKRDVREQNATWLSELYERIKED